MSIGYLELHEKRVVLRFGGITIEAIVPKKLSQINNIVSFDDTGYFVLDTNYGEEYLDLEYALSWLDLDVQLQERLSKIDEFRIVKEVDNMKYKKSELAELENAAYMIVDNIAFTPFTKEGKPFLSVRDLNNSNYQACFALNSASNDFELVSSTFVDGKRKYTMLYSLERNKAELIEGCCNG